MKKLSFLIACIITIFTAGAQLRSTPAEVTNAFSKAYPGATNVTWHDKLTNFEAEFDLAGDHTVTKYTKKGEWLSTEQDIKPVNLTANVKDGLNKSKYKDWAVKEVKSIQEKGKESVYRITVVKESDDLLKRYLFFNAQGQLKRDALTL